MKGLLLWGRSWELCNRAGVIKAIACLLHFVLWRRFGVGCIFVYLRTQTNTMTRVVVQRGGLSNQTPSRPPSNSASVTPSATASSSTTLPLSSQSPALSVPSSYTVLSSSLSLVSGDESPDIPGSEPRNFDGELYSSNLTGASVTIAVILVLWIQDN